MKQSVSHYVMPDEKEEGHQILKLEDNEDGTYTLIVRKVEE